MVITPSNLHNGIPVPLADACVHSHPVGCALAARRLISTLLTWIDFNISNHMPSQVWHQITYPFPMMQPLKSGNG